MLCFCSVVPLVCFAMCLLVFVCLFCACLSVVYWVFNGVAAVVVVVVLCCLLSLLLLLCACC